MQNRSVPKKKPSLTFNDMLPVFAVFVLLAVLLALARKPVRPRLTPSSPSDGHAGGLQIHLCTDTHGGESLIFEGSLTGTPDLFMIDTGYAGPPVLSSSYLASKRPRDTTGTVPMRFARTMSVLRNDPGEDARQRAVRRLLAHPEIRSFTSGCTMRLMGVGATSETQADMILAPALTIGGVAQAGTRWSSDVFVTHPLQGNVHILTCDYLLHRAPCLILAGKPGVPGRLLLALSPSDVSAQRTSFEFHAGFFVGGAFAVRMNVGGSMLRIVVDTGATTTVSLSRAAAIGMARCALPAEGPRRSFQTGVHGERICSDVLTASIRIGSVEVPDVPVHANDTGVEGADGYMGMGVLRMFDLWLEPQRIGFRFNGLPHRASHGASGSCGTKLPRCAGAPK